MAYTLVDVDSAVSDELISRLPGFRACSPALPPQLSADERNGFSIFAAYRRARVRL